MGRQKAGQGMGRKKAALPMTERAFMTAYEREAVEEVRFCLLNGHQPFRVDVEILVGLVDRAYSESKRCTCGKWAIVHRYGCPAGDVVT